MLIGSIGFEFMRRTSCIFFFFPFRAANTRDVFVVSRIDIFFSLSSFPWFLLFLVQIIIPSRLSTTKFKLFLKRTFICFRGLILAYHTAKVFFFYRQEAYSTLVVLIPILFSTKPKQWIGYFIRLT